MKKGRKIYFILLLIIVFLVSTMYFSYAFFTSKNEEHGKLNIVAGTLDYKIEGKDLENNQITVLAHEIEKVELTIESLNKISSMYELYYNTENNNDIEIGYSIDSIDKISGKIESNSKKKVTVIIKNNSDTDKVINLGVEGGLINNNLVLTKGKSLNNEINLCNYEAGKTFTFDYTGNSQLFTTLCEGNYQVELWGASGGHYNDIYSGGKGGYTKGNIYLEEAENFYINVGQTSNCITGTPGYTIRAYNGGGLAGSPEEWPGRNFCGGGGATDIRMTKGSWDSFNSLKSRIMVASAGGGANFFWEGVYSGIGGSGGGLIGYDGTGINNNTTSYGKGGTQTSTLFGYGLGYPTGGAGSGYYGGYVNDNWSGGGGGSSFISGHNGCDAIKEESTSSNIIHTGQSVHYSNYSFYDTVMIDGEGHNWTNEKGNVVVGMPTHDGTSTMIGNSGNGYAKITYLGKANNVYDTYKIGDEVTLKDGSKWHVLEYSSNDNQYVTLLSDYNLNSDGTYNDECQGNINDSGSYQCSTRSFDVDGTNIYDENDNNNIGYFIKNTYAPLVKKSLSGVINVDLPTVQQIAHVENISNIENGFSIKSSWLKTTNYWTKNVFNDTTDQVFSVYGYYSSANSYHSIYNGGMGVRPVIIISKKQIIKTIPSTTNLAIGTPVEAIDGSKWHVLENSDSNSKYVTLLSDYNLNDDGTYNTECRMDISGTGICSNRVFSVGVQGVYDETNTENIGYFIKNTYAPLVSMLETTNITLPTAEQSLKADSKEFTQFPNPSDENKIILQNDWLTYLSYWTKTISDVDNNYVYVVLWDRSMFLRFFSSKSYGARPVITTLKTNLLQK